MIMVQSKTIENLMAIYKDAKRCYERKNASSFYRCLKNNLLDSICNPEDKEDILKQYEMSCKTYLESNVLNFNITLSALIISLAAFFVSAMSLLTSLMKSISIDVKIVQGSVKQMAYICCALMIFVLVRGIWDHFKNRKLQEVLYVIGEIRQEMNKEVDKKERTL